MLVNLFVQEQVGLDEENTTAFAGDYHLNLSNDHGHELGKATNLSHGKRLDSKFFKSFKVTVHVVVYSATVSSLRLGTSTCD